MSSVLLKLSGLFLLITVIECENNQLFVLRKVYEQCGNQTDVFKCLKIKALKFTERAMKAKKLEIFGWVDVVQERNLAMNRTGRLLDTMGQSEENLQRLDEKNITDLLYDSASNFLETHIISFNLPKMVEEARRRKKNRFAGALLAAIAAKGVLMSMAYKSIAVVAGTALIVGKMALVLAAVLGLKKIMSGEKEKTTVEIVKHPTHSNSHSYTSSYEEGEGHYHRSINSAENMIFLDSLYGNTY